MPTDSKPSRNEDEYFAKVDADLRKLLRERADAERAEKVRTDRNKCPRCGVAMVAKESRHVTIDQCPSCEGIWLDKGELEILAVGEGKSTGFVGSLLNIFR